MNINISRNPNIKNTFKVIEKNGILQTHGQGWEAKFTRDKIVSIHIPRWSDVSLSHVETTIERITKSI